MENIGQVLVLLVGGLLIWGIWGITQPRRVFLIRVVQGIPRIAQGKVTAAFLLRVREVAESHGVQNATVSGLAQGDRITLRFSRQLPKPACQQLRNWWVVSGWRTGKRPK